jgi:hypothetical protein
MEPDHAGNSSAPVGLAFPIGFFNVVVLGYAEAVAAFQAPTL